MVRDARVAVGDEAEAPPLSLRYRPPEILLGSQTYAPPVDIWAVGTILVEMVTKRPMFPGECEIDELYKIFRVLGTPTDDCWPGARAGGARARARTRGRGRRARSRVF